MPDLSDLEIDFAYSLPIWKIPPKFLCVNYDRIAVNPVRGKDCWFNEELRGTMSAYLKREQRKREVVLLREEERRAAELERRVERERAARAARELAEREEREKAEREEAERERDKCERVERERVERERVEREREVEREEEVREREEREREEQEREERERTKRELASKEKLEKTEREDREKAGREVAEREHAIKEKLENTKRKVHETAERGSAIRERKPRSTPSEIDTTMAALERPASDEALLSTLSGMTISALKECGVCAYEVPAHDCILITPTEDVACSPCFETGVKPLFENALLYEHEYPAKWGAVVLDTLDFSKHLPQGFTTKWVFRQREYDRPAKEMVYCRHHVLSDDSSITALGQLAILSAVDTDRSMHECGRFLGGTLPPTAARSIYDCLSCEGATCGICATSFLQDGLKHVCIDAVEGAQAEDDPYRAMKRGKDYQRCPKCETPIELSEGCNFMTCRCRVCFCYICGMELLSDETIVDHFEIGKPCPKWNQPGAINTHYDLTPVMRSFNDAEIHIDHGTRILREGLRTLGALIAMKLGWAQDPAKIQTWEALQRLVEALRYILQFQHIVTERLQTLQEVRDEYVQKQRLVEEMVAIVTTPAALERQRVHGLDPRVAAAVALYRGRHDAFVQYLEGRISAITARQAMDAANRAVRVRAMNDTEWRRILRVLQDVRGEIRDIETQDPANEGKRGALWRVCLLTSRALRIQFFADVLPQPLWIIEDFRARYLKVRVEIGDLAAVAEVDALSQNQTAIEPVGLREPQRLLEERHVEFMRRIDSAIAELAGREVPAVVQQA
ncbi:hypothetical protein B0A55_10675 [Friedmanniomyces simplex]|uniref:Uncharacterized protein n=1 Tax=Friedmanniomyces simplex TaxID=329884 RepID=A0A4U0WM98_9PEZI|nr:hypothetical protein B0A55_10675 [Friedmanniomyces simplex]